MKRKNKKYISKIVVTALLLTSVLFQTVMGADFSVPIHPESESWIENGNVIGNDKLSVSSSAEDVFTEINEAIDECEEINIDEYSTGLKSGQRTSLPTYCSNGETSAAITSNGDLYCWGDNSHGQVGNGSTTDQSIPVKVLSNVISVSSYSSATMAAITDNGDLYCWGDNSHGQVGNGNSKDQNTPVKVLSNVTSVSVYEYTTMLAITNNGDLYCWGYNFYGQVGNGNTEDQNTPVKVLDNVTSVFGPGDGSRYGYNRDYITIAALTNNGDLYYWGYGVQSTPVKVLDNVTSVSVYASIYGNTTMAAITDNGDLYCWGDNSCGQVGNGNNKDQSTPVKVLSNVTSVFGYGDTTIAAITSNGDLYCWGNNSYGQVGNGSITDQSLPVKVLDNVISVFGYGETTMAATTSNGDLYCWGDNSYGQVGNGNTENQSTPVKVLDNVTFFSGHGPSYDSYCITMTAITSNKNLYCWGYGSYGYAENDNTTNQNIPIKVLDNVTSVFSYGSGSSYGSGPLTITAITSNGDLYCWGYNVYGQVGNGNTEDQSTPVKVLNNVTSVFGSDYSTARLTMAATTGNGDLYCWGCNYCGQVGNGNTTNQRIPIKIFNLMTGSQTLSPSPTVTPTDSTKQTQKMTVTPGSLELYVGGNTKQLKVSNAKGKVTYNNSNPKVITIGYKGKVTPLSKGKATITVTAAGDATYKTASKKINVTVYSKPAKVKSVKAVPGKSKRTLKVSWKKVSSVSGYIIKYSYNKNMKNSATIKVNGGNSNSKTIKMLTSKKYVYIQVQAYKKDGNTQIKGSWSTKTKSKGKIK